MNSTDYKSWLKQHPFTLAQNAALCFEQAALEIENAAMFLRKAARDGKSYPEDPECGWGHRGQWQMKYRQHQRRALLDATKAMRTAEVHCRGALRQLKELAE